MLFRGRPLGRKPVAASTPAEDLAPRPSRVLPRTPMYPEGPFAHEEGPADRPETVADRLVKLLKDRRFHSDVDLASSMAPAEILSAVMVLLARGYAFDRSGRSLRIRMRQKVEMSQDLSTVVDGLDFSEVVAKPERSEREAAGEVGGVASSERHDFAVEPGDVESVGLVLSEPPDHLTLPLSHLGSLVGAILAKRGAGKTYLGMVLVEELLEVEQPLSVVVFDPTGVWWGLCATEAGAPSSYELLLLGGSRGHLPLSPGDGARVAELCAERHPARVVVDLSQVSPAEQHGFVADFCERLMAAPHFPIHVVFDEADEFAPQRLKDLSGNQKRSLACMERLVMRGRSRGIGATLITLRPAVLSKNVLSQVDALYLLRMVEPNDIKAVRGWLENFEAGVTPEQREQCLGLLPVLPTGTSYFLRGGEPVMFRRFKVRRKRTYDSSRTPESGVVVDAVLGRPRADLLASARKIWSAK